MPEKHGQENPKLSSQYLSFHNISECFFFSKRVRPVTSDGWRVVVSSRPRQLLAQELGSEEAKEMRNSSVEARGMLRWGGRGRFFLFEGGGEEVLKSF